MSPSRVEALLAVLFPHLAGLRVHRVEDVDRRGDHRRVVPGGAGGVLPAVRVSSRRECMAGIRAWWLMVRRAGGRC